MTVQLSVHRRSICGGEACIVETRWIKWSNERKGYEWKQAGSKVANKKTKWKGESHDREDDGEEKRRD